jgi:hypothetical protein
MPVFLTGSSKTGITILDQGYWVNSKNLYGLCHQDDKTNTKCR